MAFWDRWLVGLVDYQIDCASFQLETGGSSLAPQDGRKEILTSDEFDILKSQIVTSSWDGIRKLPYAFTEQGVAMLSSVLRSKRAIHVNIEIMRAFVKLHDIVATHKDLARKLEALEKKYDEQFAVVFKAIRQLMTPSEPPPKRRIGFGVEEPKAVYHAKRRRP